MTRFNERLDEIVNKAISVTVTPKPRSLEDEAVVEVRLQFSEHVAAAIRTLIKEEIIGFDDPVHELVESNDPRLRRGNIWMVRNDLRAEQRKKF